MNRKKKIVSFLALALLFLMTTALYAEEPWMQGRDPNTFKGALTLARG